MPSMPRLVRHDQRNIVVAFTPVDPAEDCHPPPSRPKSLSSLVICPGENARRPNDKALVAFPCDEAVRDPGDPRGSGLTFRAHRLPM